MLPNITSKIQNFPMKNSSKLSRPSTSMKNSNKLINIVDKNKQKQQSLVIKTNSTNVEELQGYLNILLQKYMELKSTKRQVLEIVSNISEFNILSDKINNTIANKTNPLRKSSLKNNSSNNIIIDKNKQRSVFNILEIDRLIELNYVSIKKNISDNLQLKKSVTDFFTQTEEILYENFLKNHSKVLDEQILSLKSVIEIKNKDIIRLNEKLNDLSIENFLKIKLENEQLNKEVKLMAKEITEYKNISDSNNIEILKLRNIEVKINQEKEELIVNFKTLENEIESLKNEIKAKESSIIEKDMCLNNLKSEIESLNIINTNNDYKNREKEIEIRRNLDINDKLSQEIINLKEEKNNHYIDIEKNEKYIIINEKYMQNYNLYVNLEKQFNILQKDNEVAVEKLNISHQQIKKLELSNKNLSNDIQLKIKEIKELNLFKNQYTQLKTEKDNNLSIIKNLKIELSELNEYINKKNNIISKMSSSSNLTNKLSTNHHHLNLYPTNTSNFKNNSNKNVLSQDSKLNFESIEENEQVTNNNVNLMNVFNNKYKEYLNKVQELEDKNNDIFMKLNERISKLIYSHNEIRKRNASEILKQNNYSTKLKDLEQELKRVSLELEVLSKKYSNAKINYSKLNKKTKSLEENNNKLLLKESELQDKLNQYIIENLGKSKVIDERNEEINKLKTYIDEKTLKKIYDVYK